MQGTHRADDVKSLDQVRLMATNWFTRLAPHPYANLALTRELFCDQASWCSREVAGQIYDEVGSRGLGRRRMQHDLTRPAAENAHLWNFKVLEGDTTGSWATWAIASPWWRGLVLAQTPEIFKPRVIAYRVLEENGLFLPKVAFHNFWLELMASIEIGGVA